MTRRNPTKRSRPRKQSVKNRAKAVGLRRTALECIRDSQGRCQAGIDGVCVANATAVHHKLLRSQGGTDQPSNLMAVCCFCHFWIHDHPIEAARLGFIILRSSPNY